MLKLVDLLGLIHIPGSLNINDFNLTKRKGNILSTVKDELKAVGTKCEVAKLPVDTVIVNSTFNAHKQTREIIYENTNPQSKAAKKRESPAESELRLNKSLIKPDIEGMFDYIYGQDINNTQGSKKGIKKKDRALCNICSKTYATKAYLKEHMTTHETKESKKDKTSERATCNVSSKTLASKHILKAHMKLHDPQSGKHNPEHSICNICFKTTSSKIKLLVHMAKKHGKKEYGVCTNCGSKLSMTSIDRHQRLSKKSEKEKKKRKRKTSSGMS